MLMTTIQTIVSRGRVARAGNKAREGKEAEENRAYNAMTTSQSGLWSNIRFLSYRNARTIVNKMKLGYFGSELDETLFC